MPAPGNITRRSTFPSINSAELDRSATKSLERSRFRFGELVEQQRHDSRPIASSICSGWPIRRGPASAEHRRARQSAAMESVSHGRRHDGRSDDFQRHDNAESGSKDPTVSGARTISRPISAAKRTTCPGGSAGFATEMNLWKQEPAIKVHRPRGGVDIGRLDPRRYAANRDVNTSRHRSIRPWDT